MTENITEKNEEHSISNKLFDQIRTYFIWIETLLEATYIRSQQRKRMLFYFWPMVYEFSTTIKDMGQCLDFAGLELKKSCRTFPANTKQLYNISTTFIYETVNDTSDNLCKLFVLCHLCAT